MTHPHHHIQLRVYYEDTDAGGVVYHASYLRYAERGRTEMLRTGGLTNSNLAEEQGVLFVVRKLAVDYLKPARLDDCLTLTTFLEEMRSSSFLMRQEIMRGNELLCVCNVTLVTVNRAGRPVRLPDSVREMLLARLPESQDRKSVV